jgi:hypothetical protein
MTGGLLQLVAKGYDDLYISGNPEVTLFKTIYRRHSNFSKVDRYININHKMAFGTSYTCIIKHFGDLLHRMFMEITLPKIIPGTNLTNPTIIKIVAHDTLLTYGVSWDYTGESTDPITATDITEISPLVQARELEITNSISLLNTYKSTLLPFKNYTYYSRENIVAYFNSLTSLETFYPIIYYFYVYFASDAWVNYAKIPKTCDGIQVILYNQLFTYIFQKFEDEIINKIIGSNGVGSNYIYLNVTESSIDNYYTLAVSGFDWYVEINNQVRKIISYTGSSKKAIVADWTTTPTYFRYNLYNKNSGGFLTSASIVEIYTYLNTLSNYFGIYVDKIRKLVEYSNIYVIFDDIASSVDHYYDNWIIRFGSNVSRILSYLSENNTLIETVDNVPTIGEKYHLYNTPSIYYASGNVSSITTSGTFHYVVLSGNISTTNNFYSYWFLKFTNKTDSTAIVNNYVFQIISYEGSTKTACVYNIYNIELSETYSYILFREMIPEYSHSVIGADNGETDVSFDGLLYIEFFSGKIASASEVDIIYVDDTIPTKFIEHFTTESDYAIHARTDANYVLNGTFSMISAYDSALKKVTTTFPSYVLPDLYDSYLIYSKSYSILILETKTTITFKLKARKYQDVYRNQIVGDYRFSSLTNYYKGWFLHMNPSTNMESIISYVNSYSGTSGDTIATFNVTPLKRNSFNDLLTIFINPNKDFLFDYYKN